MDAHTLELLEFEKVRRLLADFASTGMGKELALGIQPMTSIAPIRAELAIVAEMIETLGSGQTPPFTGIQDVRLIVRRAQIGTMLTAEQLLQVAETLIGTGAIYRFRMRLDSKAVRLIELLTPIEDLGPMAKTITSCIDGRAHILDQASPELTSIRNQLFEIDEKVKNEINRLLRDPEVRKILRYPNATINGDHYVLPVAANHRAKIPGVVHRTSSTGETIFIEPHSVSRFSAERVILKGDEDREEKRILRRLSGEVGKLAKHLTMALDIISRLDLITAKSRYALDFDMYPPDFNEEGRLWLRTARHPVLQHLIRQENRQRSSDATEPPREVVPIEVRLGVGFNLLVITGPNTGGKTVTLKTTGLLCLMAQCGMPIPASEGSQVPLFKHILADIGDEQSLEQSLSTFSSHISRIAHILHTATSDSLILLDEMGAGTDPTEGAALGRAILDQLGEIGCRAIVTTHLGDLKTYAFNNDHAENGAVEFNIETLRPTYRLHIGQFGMSNALKIARRLKLPKGLINKAHRYLNRKKGKTRELSQLQQLREEAEKARAEALVAQHEANLQKLEYEHKLLELEKTTQESNKLREWRYKLQAGEMVHVQKFDKAGKVVRIDARKQTVIVSVGIGQWEIPLEEIHPVKS
jgi:DNA mismatch repair protein MutS2